MYSKKEILDYVDGMDNKFIIIYQTAEWVFFCTSKNKEWEEVTSVNYINWIYFKRWRTKIQFDYWQKNIYLYKSNWKLRKIVDRWFTITQYRKQPTYI